MVNFCQHTLWETNSLLLKIAIEIVDLPIDKMVDLSIVFVNVYQGVVLKPTRIMWATFQEPPVKYEVKGPLQLGHWRPIDTHFGQRPRTIESTRIERENV